MMLYPITTCRGCDRLWGRNSNSDCGVMSDRLGLSCVTTVRTSSVPSAIWLSAFRVPTLLVPIPSNRLSFVPGSTSRSVLH
jgi:hypothetical protein